jgi:hypothetical protein
MLGQLSGFGQCRQIRCPSVDTPKDGATSKPWRTADHPADFASSERARDLGLLGLVLLGGSVVVALLIAVVWYCLKQIAKW